MRIIAILAAVACLALLPGGISTRGVKKPAARRPPAGKESSSALLGKGRRLGKAKKAVSGARKTKEEPHEEAIAQIGEGPEAQVKEAVAESRSKLAGELNALQHLRSTVAASAALNGELVNATAAFDSLAQEDERAARNLTRLEVGLSKAGQRERWLEGLVRKLLKADKFLKVKVERQTATSNELKHENEELVNDKRVLTAAVVKQKGKMDAAVQKTLDAEARAKAAEEETASIKGENEAIRVETQKEQEKLQKSEAVNARTKATLVRLAKSAEQVAAEKTAYEKRLESAAAEIQKLATEVTALRQQHVSDELRKSASDLASSMRKEQQHTAGAAATGQQLTAAAAVPGATRAPGSATPASAKPKEETAPLSSSDNADDFSKIVDEAQALTTNIYVQLAESSDSPADDKVAPTAKKIGLRRKKTN